MAESNIVSLTGNKVLEPGKPSEKCIEALEYYLERAKAGEVQGVCLVALHGDSSASWHCGGIVGGYSILGALQMVQSTLVAINNETD